MVCHMILNSAFALAAVQLLRRGADNSSAARRRELILIALAGLGWCALLLAPASIVVRLHTRLSDRYAYVPFAGIGWSCGALVVLAHRALAHQSALLASLTAAWIATGVFAVSTAVFTTLLFTRKKSDTAAMLIERGFSLGGAPLPGGGALVGGRIRF